MMSMYLSGICEETDDHLNMFHYTQYHHFHMYMSVRVVTLLFIFHCAIHIHLHHVHDKNTHTLENDKAKATQPIVQCIHVHMYDHTCTYKCIIIYIHSPVTVR